MFQRNMGDGITEEDFKTGAKELRNVAAQKRETRPTTPERYPQINK
jgi:hypothetical protein